MGTEPEMTQQPPGGPGRIGAYEVRGELGRGGMGAVYRGWDPALGREVAIKGVLVSDPRTLERLRREAEALARLRHPNVVPVHAVEEDRGRPYLVMPLVEGRTLEERLGREGPLPVEEAASLIAVLSRAVHHAHGHAVLHRDLKPENVILTEDGPVVTDFGLARDLSGSDQRLTQSGTLLGTPGYMSPEQAGGDLSRVDVRSDVYGLGATLFAALTGRPPVEGRTFIECVVATHDARVPSPRSLRREVPEPLSAICLKALSKDPADRPPSAEALAEELEAYLSTPPATSGRWLLLALCVGVGLGAIAIQLVSTSGPAPRGELPRTAPVSTATEAPPAAPDTSAGELQALEFQGARDAQFSAGDQFAVTLSDTELGFWELSSGRRIHSHAPSSILEDMRVDPSGDRVAYAGSNQVLWIADTRSGKLFEEHRVPTYVYALAWSPDGQRIAFGGRTGDLYVLEPRSGDLVQHLGLGNVQVMALAFSGDGKRLVVATEPRKAPGELARIPEVTLLKWTAAGFAEPIICRVRGEPVTLLFGPDDRRIFVGDQGGSITAFPVEGFGGPGGIQFNDPAVASTAFVSQAHRGRVHGLAFLSGQRLLSAGGHSARGGRLGLWDRRSGELVRKLRGGGFHGLDLSDDGRRVLLARNREGRVEVWELEALLAD